jgi:hypothetical protein
MKKYTASLLAFHRYLSTVFDRTRGKKAAPFFAGQIFLASLNDTASDANPVTTAGSGFWMKGYGSKGDRNGADISSKYGYNTGGISLGYDQIIGKSFYCWESPRAIPLPTSAWTTLPTRPQYLFTRLPCMGLIRRLPGM